jgi:hypothetical protein
MEKILVTAEAESLSNSEPNINGLASPRWTFADFDPVQFADAGREEVHMRRTAKSENVYFAELKRL